MTSKGNKYTKEDRALHFRYRDKFIHTHTHTYILYYIYIYIYTLPESLIQYNFIFRTPQFLCDTPIPIKFDSHMQNVYKHANTNETIISVVSNILAKIEIATIPIIL